jgi:hypothetical protein
MSDARIQGSYCAVFDQIHRRRGYEHGEGSLEQDAELVLLCRRELLFVWREYHLLLQGTMNVIELKKLTEMSISTSFLQMLS